jgi:hypothetical protein
MKSRLKQQIFAISLLALLYLLPMLCKHIYFANNSKIRLTKQSLGLFGTGCLEPYPKKGLRLTWKQ